MRTSNLERKTALCERAEALKDSTDWKKTADAITELQKEWKTIGPVDKNTATSSGDVSLMRATASSNAGRKPHQASAVPSERISRTRKR